MRELTSAGCTTTHVPVHVDPPEMTPTAARSFDGFAAAAIGTWLVCGLWPMAAVIDGRLPGVPAALLGLMFAMYGAAVLTLLRLARRARPVQLWVPFTLALLQTVIGIGVNAATMAYLNGTGMGLGLLVIVAAELPYFLSRRGTWTWILLQTVAMTVAISGHGFGLEIASFMLVAVGFQVFAAASSILALNEGRARTSLARTNAELKATRELLAESSRSSERLRISRDLHDTLGHHLTALSLQLDVAARLSDGKAVDHIQQAHAITRLLLNDVRDVVSTLRETSRMDLTDSIRALAVQPLAARVHLDLPAILTVDDSERAEAILRAVQEVLTNTARHACASNIWIRLEQSNDGMRLHVRDDGHGAAGLVWGNGLRGIQERFAQHGGRCEIRTAACEGFELQAFMPARRAV